MTDTPNTSPGDTGSFGAIIRRLGLSSALAIGALVLPPLGSIALFATAKPTGEWLRSHGHAGVLLFTAAFALLSGTALLPTYVQCALGGFAFGVTVGVPAALAGFVGGATIGYLISRRISGDRVERILEGKPKWLAVRDALMGTRGLPPARAFFKQLGMVTLLRLPPNSPFAFTNWLMASVKVPLAPFAIGTMFGLLPRSALAVFIGAGIKDALTSESLDAAMPRWVWFAGIGLTGAIVLLIGWMAARAVDRMMKRPPAA